MCTKVKLNQTATCSAIEYATSRCPIPAPLFCFAEINLGQALLTRLCRNPVTEPPPFCRNSASANDGQAPTCRSSELTAALLNSKRDIEASSQKSLDKLPFNEVDICLEEEEAEDRIEEGCLDPLEPLVFTLLQNNPVCVEVDIIEIKTRLANPTTRYRLRSNICIFVGYLFLKFRPSIIL